MRTQGGGSKAGLAPALDSAVGRAVERKSGHDRQPWLLPRLASARLPWPCNDTDLS